MPCACLRILLALCLVPASFARAANIAVPAADTGALIAAITTANGNGEDDVITLAAGSTYAVTTVNNGVTGLPVVTGTITIMGNGATIQRTGATQFRLFDVATTGDLTLDRVTVTGGAVTFQGAVPGGTDGGAGIRVLGAGKLTLSNAAVSGNTCTGNVCLGGGILVYDDDNPVVTLTDSVVSGNFSVQGGGICLRHNAQTLSLTRTTVSGNTGIEGGGIACNGDDMVTITDSTFSGNSVSELVPGGALGGGLLDIGGGTYVIAGTTFTGNSASGANANNFATNIYGGAMAENGGATITMVNSTVTGNSLTNSAGGLVGGAGLFSEGGGSWTLNNVTIAGNTITGSNGSGGGIEATRGIFTLRNSILHGNTASRNPDCSALGDNVSGPVFDSFILTEGHNIVGNTTGCVGFVAGTGDQVGADPQLGPLANNGGSTQTRAIPAGSPADDAGDPGTPGTGTGCETTDQRGTMRPQGARCDIGAFEREVGTNPTTTTTTTTLPFGGCDGPPAPTFASIDCRLAALQARVQAATDLGRLERTLEKMIGRAREKTTQAEQFDAAGRGKPSKNALKKAIRQMINFTHKVRSLPGRKIIPQATRDGFVAAADPIRADMKTLRSAL